MVKGTRDFNNTTTSQYSGSISVQTTASEDVDRPGQGNSWQTSTWEIHNGYYKSHSSTKSVINKLGMWTIGKGYKADDKIKKILDKIKGSGKDTFDEIIGNCVRVRHIDGDCYAEIIGGKGTRLTNLKPLNPGSIKVVYTDKGFISHYLQVLADGKEERFETEEIFHLSLNRTADEIHGRGDIEALTTYLDKIKQIDEDMAVVFHRYVVPLIIWKLQTDKTGEIDKFKGEAKTARDGGQDIFIPQKAVEWDLIEAGKNGIDPIVWRKTWVEEITKGGGVPALIMSIEAGTTEASSKMVYLAWQQVIETEQNYIQKQIKLQLGLDVEFEFPARIEENLGEDEGKDGGIQTTKKSEVQVTTIKKGDKNPSNSSVKAKL